MASEAQRSLTRLTGEVELLQRQVRDAIFEEKRLERQLREVQASIAQRAEGGASSDRASLESLASTVSDALTAQRRDVAELKRSLISSRYLLENARRRHQLASTRRQSALVQKELLRDDEGSANEMLATLERDVVALEAEVDAIVALEHGVEHSVHTQRVVSQEERRRNEQQKKEEQEKEEQGDTRPAAGGSDRKKVTE